MHLNQPNKQMISCLLPTYLLRNILSAIKNGAYTYNAGCFHTI